MVHYNSTVVWNFSDIFSLLEIQLGPRRQQLTAVIPITIIYVIIFITGLMGNISTIVVVAMNSYMHTSTNFYLCNLVVSDLLMLVVGLPQETYWFWSAYPWVFGQLFCVVRTMAAETATYASIMTITAFTVERYVAICHPMKAKAMSSLQRAVKVIAGVWIVSGCSSIPIWFRYGVTYLRDAENNVIPESALCSIRFVQYIEYCFSASSFVFFVLPMTLITVLYVLIGISIRRSTTLSRVNSDANLRPSDERTQLRYAAKQAKARLAVIKMLVAVVVAFFVCWAPFHCQRLMSSFVSQPNSAPGLGQVFFFYVSGVMYYVSAIVNPILYHVMSLKFRQAFKDTLRPLLCCRRPKRRRPATVRLNYTFTDDRRPQRPDGVGGARPTAATATARRRSGRTAAVARDGGGGEAAGGAAAAAAPPRRVVVDSAGDVSLCILTINSYAASSSGTSDCDVSQTSIQLRMRSS